MFIKNNSHIGWEIVGMKRIEKEDYPGKAVREAIVNAIIHRDYQITGSEIHIDMFEDRLEITSPGGMIDGSLIQELDITKISSIRRNRVISDIFNRLHFMERRGSGLTRIVESYNDCKYKPEFISDSSSFKVIFPNKGYIKHKSETSGSQINKNSNHQNLVSDEDYFILRLHKCLPINLQKRTYDQIQKLFDEFTYLYEFKREDIETILNIRRSRAIDIIKLLVNSGLLEQVDYLKYRFKK